MKEAERRFQVRVKLPVPRFGLGQKDTAFYAWLRARFGAKGFQVTPASWDGVTQAIAVHFDDASAAAELVAWYALNVEAMPERP